LGTVIISGTPFDFYHDINDAVRIDDQLIQPIEFNFVLDFIFKFDGPRPAILTLIIVENHKPRWPTFVDVDGDMKYITRLELVGPPSVGPKALIAKGFGRVGCSLLASWLRVLI